MSFYFILFIMNNIKNEYKLYESCMKIRSGQAYYL